MWTPDTFERLLTEHLVPLAHRAGEVILSHRERGIDTQHKSDNSPVTQADREADALICEGLLGLDAAIPIVSEEGSQHESAARLGTFWCVDPLDGTRGFIRGEDQFTVNIALVHERIPVLGVITAPAMGTGYAGALGAGAWKLDATGNRMPIRCRALPTDDTATALTSRYHVAEREHALALEYGAQRFSSASSSLKFCLIAEGLADIYPRAGTTMEWDTAAGQAILSAAGGCVLEAQHRTPLLYGKPAFRNGQFIALGAVRE